MISYCSLSKLKDQSPNPEDTTDATTIATNDARLLQYGIRATGAIDQLKKITFAPLIETRYYDSVGDRVSSYYIMLDKPILSLTSVTLPDTNTLTVDTVVRIEPRTDTPGWQLRIINSGSSFNITGTTLDNDIAVVGQWGWHSDYNNAWVVSGDSVQDGAGINASVTSITVTDADGAGGDGFTPRFSAGNLIKIDSEYMAIVATNTTTQVLTVVRGVRGSTAATHATSAAISVYAPDYAIERACQLITDFNYSRRGKHERVSFDGVQTVAGLEIPQEAIDLLDSYQLVNFVGV